MYVTSCSDACSTVQERQKLLHETAFLVHYAPCSPPYLLNVVDQRVAVLLPVVLERVLVRELVTTELQSDFKAVAAEVVEILHSCHEIFRKKERIAQEEKMVSQAWLPLPHFKATRNQTWPVFNKVFLTPRHAVPGSSVSDAIFEAGVVVVLTAGGSLVVGHHRVVHRVGLC